MRKIIKATLLLIFVIYLFLDAEEPKNYSTGNSENEILKYNLTYCFQMEMAGRVALVVPYRFFHEVGASVNFTARKLNPQHYEFCYDGIGDTGYVMASGGMTGNSLYFFTADYDLKKAEDFRERKILEFKKAEPYYAQKIKKIRRRPMKILSEPGSAIRFIRKSSGIHQQSTVNMHLTDSHSFTYSNIYKIMGKLIHAYNHSFLPKNKGVKKIWDWENWPTKVWHSPFLDFSKILGDAAKLTSEGAEKRAKFNQKHRFRLKYQVTSLNHKWIEICGESYPAVKIWKDLKVGYVQRKVKLRTDDHIMLEDYFYIDFRNDKGKGGTVELNLSLIEN